MPPIFINGGFYNSDTRISWTYCERMGKRVCFLLWGWDDMSPLNDGVLMGGGGYFLFDTSNLQKLLNWHDFSGIFFLNFFVQSYLYYAFVGKLEIPKFTVGRKICLFRSLYVMVCQNGWARGLKHPPPPPSLFEKVCYREKERKRARKNKWPANVTDEVSKYAHLTVIKCLKPPEPTGGSAPAPR